MKHILTVALLASIVAVGHSKDQATTEKGRDPATALVNKAGPALIDAEWANRTAWANTTAYLSNEMAVYRAGGTQTLADLATGIIEAKARTPSNAPAYIQLRLLEFDEQLKYLVKRLASLLPEDLKDRSAGPCNDFDQCVRDLEQAVDQANDDAGTLAKSVGKRSSLRPVVATASRKN